MQAQDKPKGGEVPTKIVTEEMEIQIEPTFEIGGSPPSKNQTKWMQFGKVVKDLPLQNGTSQWVRFKVATRTHAYGLIASLQHLERYKIDSENKVQGAVRRNGEGYDVWCRMIDTDHWKERNTIPAW
jgi:hypothetical protein